MPFKNKADALAYQRQYGQQNRQKLATRDHTYYVENRGSILEKGRIRAAQTRDWMREFKKKPCVDCGGSFPPECMHFDHVRGEKKFNVGQTQGNRGRIAEEIAKCELVCSNCHATRTRKRREK